jgi:hypothetical protein
MLAGRFDVALCRAEGLGQPFPAELTRRLVRYEPLGLLMLNENPLAAMPQVPCDKLRGVEVDASVGNEEAPEWVDLAVQLVEAFGGRPSPSHPHVVGAKETARHLKSHGLPDPHDERWSCRAGAVVRPLVDPVPLYPWAMVNRTTQHTARWRRYGRSLENSATRKSGSNLHRMLGCQTLTR